MENAHCLLADAKLGHEFWGEVVPTGVHIHNYLPSWSHDDISAL